MVALTFAYRKCPGKAGVFSSGIKSFSGDPALPAANPVPDETIDAPKIKEPENWKDF